MVFVILQYFNLAKNLIQLSDDTWRTYSYDCCECETQWLMKSWNCPLWIQTSLTALICFFSIYLWRPLASTYQYYNDICKRNVRCKTHAGCCIETGMDRIWDALYRRYDLLSIASDLMKILLIMSDFHWIWLRDVMAKCVVTNLMRKCLCLIVKYKFVIINAFTFCHANWSL